MPSAPKKDYTRAKDSARRAMKRPLALNALDRAVKALGRSTAALPDMYRALVQGELHALVPAHGDAFRRQPAG